MIDCFAFTDVVIVGKAYVVVVAGVVCSLLVVAGTVVVAAAVLGVVEETKLKGYDDVDETVDVIVSA